MIPWHHRPIPELLVSPDTVRALAADADRLPAWVMDARQAGELSLLVTGGLAPLRGYMTQVQHDAASGGASRGAVLPWPAPVALAVDAGSGAAVSPGNDIALKDETGTVLAVMSVTDRWGTAPVLLGGRVKGLRRADWPTPNGLRSQWRAGAVARVLAVQPDHADHVSAAARLADRLGAALMVQPEPGHRLTMPEGTVAAPLPVALSREPQDILWRAALARNFGATHLAVWDSMTAQHLNQHRNAIGVEAVVPDMS